MISFLQNNIGRSTINKDSKSYSGGISSSRDTGSTTDSTTAGEKFYYGWIILIICLVLITISYGVRFSFGIFFQSLEQDFALNRALTSVIFSAYMILGALFAILGGWLSDRYGPRLVLLATGVFSFAGLALSSQVTSLWQIFLSFSLLVAIGTGPIYIIATSEAVRWFPLRRGLALAIVTCGTGLGSIWIAPVAAQFIESFGWRPAFFFLGIIAFIAIIIPSLFLRRSPTAVTTASEDNKKLNSNLNTLNRQQKETKDFSPRQAAGTRNFWLLICTWVFYAFCLFTITTHIVMHAIDKGIDPIEAATILSIIGFASILGRLSMGPLSDRVGRKPTGIISAVIMIAAMVLLMQSSSLWMFYIFACLFGIAYGGLSPSVTATVSDSFGTRHLGAIMGILDLGWVIGGAAGPAIAGYIFDVTGKYFLAFIFVALAALIVAILILFIKTPDIKKQ